MLYRKSKVLVAASKHSTDESSSGVTIPFSFLFPIIRPRSRKFKKIEAVSCYNTIPGRGWMDSKCRASKGEDGVKCPLFSTSIPPLV
jgi:hypothetical protein